MISDILLALTTHLLSVDEVGRGLLNVPMDYTCIQFLAPIKL